MWPLLDFSEFSQVCGVCARMRACASVCACAVACMPLFCVPLPCLRVAWLFLLLSASFGVVRRADGCWLRFSPGVCTADGDHVAHPGELHPNRYRPGGLHPECQGACFSRIPVHVLREREKEAWNACIFSRRCCFRFLFLSLCGLCFPSCTIIEAALKFYAVSCYLSLPLYFSLSTLLCVPLLPPSLFNVRCDRSFVWRTSTPSPSS